MTHYTHDTEHPIIIPSSSFKLDGILHIPKDATGLVLFVHGSGSSRFSTRNQRVASFLNQARIATLLFDLLTPEEEEIDSHTSELRFNIDLLTSRLLVATDWCVKQLVTHNLKIGYFGASTGAAAALIAAAKQTSHIKAVVSRGGRPDLANEYLPLVKAPTLLLVGENDIPVIKLNNDAFSQITCIREIKIIPGATHLFEEPGRLDLVADESKKWFLKYLK